MIVMSLDMKTYKLSMVSSSNFDDKIWFPNFGELRGGTQAIEYSPTEYISFFHSNIIAKKRTRLYYAGAFTFSKNPPFKILRITDSPFLSPSDANSSFVPKICYKWMRGDSKVIFPCGLIKNENNFILTYGENDCLSKGIFIKKPEIENLLKGI